MKRQSRPYKNLQAAIIDGQCGALQACAPSAVKRGKLRMSSRVHYPSFQPERLSCHSPDGHCCVRTPLDDAICPALLSSCSVAFLSALANALKVASTMWCEFFPASFLHMHMYTHSAQQGDEHVFRSIKLAFTMCCTSTAPLHAAALAAQPIQLQVVPGVEGWHGM